MHIEVGGGKPVDYLTWLCFDESAGSLESDSSTGPINDSHRLQKGSWERLQIYYLCYGFAFFF